MNKMIIRLLMSVGLSIVLFGCDQSSHKSEGDQQFVVKSQVLASELYYSSTIEPMKETSVVSPNDGVVKAIDFVYGETVKKDQLLVVIESPQMQQDYRTMVSDFLKQKDSYNTSLEQYHAAQALYKAEIIERDAFNQQKSDYENAALTYDNARFNLEQKLSQFPDLRKQLDKLTLNDLPTVMKILDKDYQRVEVRASQSGVVLLPIEQSSGNESLTIGKQVKKNGTLLTLGSMNSLAINVSVSEVDVNRFKIGEPVTVTVPALPNIKLSGRITVVGAQAKTMGSQGLAVFPVMIKVDDLNQQNQRLIRVGMTANVTVSISNPKRILIPIAAVEDDQGKPAVRVVDGTKQGFHLVDVTTGETTVDQIEITQGLKAGDVILQPTSNSGS